MLKSPIWLEFKNILINLCTQIIRGITLKFKQPIDSEIRCPYFSFGAKPDKLSDSELDCKK